MSSNCPKPIEDIRDAISFLNFSLLLPDKKRKLENITVRPSNLPFALSDHQESSCWSSWCGAHPASCSFEIRLDRSRVRVKQYLYDLGPLSSADHAALYDFEPEQMRFRIVDDRLCWLGIDYRQKVCLSARAWETNIELRLIEGEATEDELVTLFTEFSPHQTISTPFAERSYWRTIHSYRFLPRTPYKPPSSFFKLRWPWAHVEHVWLEQIPSQYKVPRHFDLLGLRFDLDSILQIGPPGAVHEVQFYFVSHAQRHHFIWLRFFPIKYRPESFEHFEVESFSGKTNWLKTEINNDFAKGVLLTEYPEVGPHDALVFTSSGDAILIQISAMQGVTSSQAASWMMNVVLSPDNPLL